MKPLFHTMLKYFLCLSFVLAVPLTHASEQIKPENAESKNANNALVDVITDLADYKTFHKTSESIEASVEKYCNKTKTNKYRNSVTVQYACNTSTGITSIRVHTIEQPGYPAYLMDMAIDFEYKDFSKIKKLLKTKLGKAHRDGKDYIGWECKSDKLLNKLGTPVVDVSRDKSGNSATFSVALEQGESER